jgi:hypothetical protein
MRHRKLTIDSHNLLRMVNHNHDSAGWVLGKVMPAVRLSDITAMLRTMAEPTPDDQRRCKSRRAYIAERLRASGMLVRKES